VNILLFDHYTFTDIIFIYFYQSISGEAKIMTLFSRKTLVFLSVVFLLVTLFSTAHADTLNAQSAATAATGVQTTVTNVFENVVTTPAVTLGAAGSVLVVSSFSMTTTNVQTPNFILTDGTTTTDPNFRRYVQGSNDHGLAQLVYLFNYGASGSQTFTLQHKVGGGTLTTTGTIVAIPLVTATNNYVLNSSVASQNTEVTTTSTTFTGVTGTTLSSLNLGASGDFYVAASLNSTSAAGNTTGIWRLEYKSSASGIWLPLGLEISRTMSGTSKIGAVSLTGVVQDMSAGNYDFRVAHRSSNGTQIGTNYINIVAVALANANVSFDTFKEFDTGVTTTSNTEVAAIIKSGITPLNNTNFFLHAVYEGVTDINLQSPPGEYDLFVEDTTPATLFDGVNQKRSFSSGSYGSGASTGLASALLASTTYNASLRHKSDGTASLSTSGYLLGIDLNSSNAFSQYPCLTEPPQSVGRTPGPDNALFFDSANSNYVSVVHDSSLDLQNTWSMECWVRPGSLTGTQGLISKGTGASLFLSGNNVEIYYNGSSQYTSTSTLTSCDFYHIAVTFDNGGTDPGTLTLYINGIQDGTASVNAPPTNTRAMYVGRGDQGVTTYYFTGTLEEVRIWKNVALTQTTIRDWMCKKVTLDHTNWSNLSGYWRFDEDSGTSCNDSSGNTNTGTTQNMSDAINRICSGAPVGDESLYYYHQGTETGVSDYTVTLDYPAEGDEITVTGDGGTWTGAGLQVYRVDEVPNKTAPPLAWGNGYTLDPLRYWGVFVTGGTSPTYSVTYKYSGHQGIDDESTLKLAYRSANCDLIWKPLGATLNITADTLTKTGIAGTEFILGGAQSGPDPLSIDLVSFTAIRMEDYVLVEWETSIELFNTGFYIWRSHKQDDDYVRLNDIIIPGEGGDTWGGVYFYEDLDTEFGTNYWYKLEDIDNWGISTFHGPITITYDRRDSSDSCFISIIEKSH
jgi:hypothetical protein